MLRRVADRTAIVVAGLAVAILLAELGLRWAQPIQPHQLVPFSYQHEDLRRIATGDARLRFDPLLGWSPAPAAAREGDGVVYRTNAAGLRADREYPPDPPPGVRRLAAFGDSFTYCDEVDNPDCWTFRLEEALPDTEVLNFGVSGYGPDQAWLRYQRDGRAYRPCAVLIGYMVENVNRVVNRFPPFYAPGQPLGKPRFLLDGEGLRLLPNPATTPEQLADPRWVEATLGPHDAWYFPGTFVANPLDVLHVVRVARTAAFRRHHEAQGVGNRGNARDLAWAYREEEQPLQVAGRVLLHFARQVREDGATPVVVVFGRRPEIVALSRGDDKVYQPLLAWLTSEGVPTLDVTDRLAEVAQQTGVPALFTRLAHYSPTANELVAETLARELPELVGATCRAGEPRDRRRPA